MAPSGTALPLMGAARRSAEASALALLFAGAFVSLLVGVAFPMSAHAPTTLGAVLLPVAAGMAIGTWWVGARLSRMALLAQVAFAAAINSVLVAAAHTPAGAVADALAYLWLAAYVAIFFPAAAVPTATLMAASYGAGLLAGGLPGLQSAWAVITVSLIALAAALARASRMMRRSIATDELTGALNRRGLQAVAGTLRARRRRCRERHAVAVLDLDGFKAINDGRGHHVGDQLLAEASAAWRGALRGADVLARTGGDEFVVVMPGTSADEAERVLERLRVAYPVAWSAGVTSWAPAEEPLTSCLQRADRRLYEAKAGR